MTAAAHTKSYSSPSDAPRLLPEMTPASHAFFSNLADLLLMRRVPEVDLTSVPDPTFWRDTRVDRRISRRALCASVLSHAAVISIIWSASAMPWPQRPRTILHDPREHTTLTYYSVSEYLPEVKSSITAPPIIKKPDPVYARQKVLSLPAEPDNLHQTIVTPPKVKLNHDVQLPNLVAAAPIQPIQAVRQRNLVMPKPTVAAPTPDPTSIPSGFRAPAIAADVVAPAPEPTIANPKLTLPTLAREAVPPPPNMVVISGSNRAVAMPAPQAVAPAPTAQVQAARELPSLANAAAPPVSPPAQRGAKSLPGIIALSTDPAEAHGAIEIPEGNRRGTFATGPEGRPGATGSPGATSADLHARGGGNVHSADDLGITIAPGPTSSPLPSGPIAARPPAPDSDRRSRLMAAMRNAASPRPPEPIKAEPPRSPIEEKVFSGKRSFTLSVNMPNFNSVTGSWIIRFAELGSGEGRAEIAAPSVINKVDPAYPPALMHDRVQGTVVLYAVIRADGSVSNVRVLSSVHQELDQNAMIALSRWHFAPGLKDGKPVDLEAVVQIPFRSRVVMMGR
ncbi:MAG TPA: TonB family protein [candidate division Zixibacteria bacterium]|nr:TonB family protein [candidate division Zixibacteria bacterium]